MAGDDVIETLLLNLFYSGQLKAMPPRLVSDDGRNIVIRPLAYCREAYIAEYAAQRGFPIIPCNLCGSQDNLQRKAVSRMLAEWDDQHPGRCENIFRALGNVSPSHLADRKLFDFAGLGREDVEKEWPEQAEPGDNRTSIRPSIHSFESE